MDISTLSIYLVAVAFVATLALIGNVVLWRQLVLMERELEKNASSIEKEGQITYLSHMSTDKKLQMFEQRLRALTDDPMLVAQKAGQPSPVSTAVPAASVTKVATVIDDALDLEPFIPQPATPQSAAPQPAAPQPAAPQQTVTEAVAAQSNAPEVAHEPSSPARTSAAEAASSIANASNLFEQGIQSDEVARRCGLTRAEAELMALVQNKSKIAS